MNFRRLITALAVLAVFAAIASAQVIQPTPISCSVSASSNRAIRSEGVTDLVGDVILTCTGGPAPAFETDGRPADRATIVVDFGVPVTSRSASGNSEALLLIDEPNSGVGPIPGFGQQATISVCAAGSTCPAFYRVIQGFPVISVTSDPAQTPLPAANAYQGTLSSSNVNRVTFANVPVVATGSQNVQRVYRITNVRVNPGSAGAINANVTVTAAEGAITTLSLANNAVTVATPQSSLTTVVSPVGTSTLCSSTAATPGAGQARANVALLKFTENFASAFKTRTLPLTDLAGAGQGDGAGQNIPSGSYTVGSATLNTSNSESGFVVPALQVSGVSAGLANFGTRLKANFRGLPSTAQIYVSLTNVVDYQTAVAAPTLIGGLASTPYARMIGVSGGVNVSGTEIAGTTIPTLTVFNAGGEIAGVQAVLLTPDSNGNAEAVWEVLNTQRDAAETLTFSVYAVYSNVTAPPAIGANGTVQLGYAPTTGTSVTAIPRFASLASSQTSFFTVAPCQTTLLFPFVTNSGGYDVGIALSNTSKDPFNTQTSEGTCAMNFYGTNAPPVFTTPVITAGNIYANTVGGMGALNFGGYAIAVCNFQFAHGFAYITAPGWGGPNSASMGYLATVINNSPNRGASLVGESLGM